MAEDAGGEPSAAQWPLIHRAAGLTVQLEQLEARVASGEEVDVLQFTNLTNALVRVLRTLGLDRRARVIAPEAAPVIDLHAKAVRASDHG